MDSKLFPKYWLFLLVILCAFLFIWIDNVGVVRATDLHNTDEDTFLYLPLLFGSHNTPIPTPTPTPTPEPSPTPTPEPSPTPTLPPVGDAIVIDHNSVALFDQIPDQYLQLARNIPMVFSDRSVGANIDAFLNCLASANDWYSTASSCRRDYYDISGSQWLWKTYSQTDYDNNLVPARILFDPDPVRYNRSNWSFIYAAGEWEELVDGFVTQIVPSSVNSKDVLSFQFSYLNIDFNSTIDNLDMGFFVDQPHHGYYPNRERWDISDLEELEVQYPNKTFIYWTTSLSRGIGSRDGENFNNQMREYAISNDKILFDVADIQSHDDFANVCYDNRDSVEYCNSNRCENHPNDGQQIIAICQDYTTEIDGGHLGSVSAGGIRIAKAFWVLMARLSGWNP